MLMKQTLTFLIVLLSAFNANTQTIDEIIGRYIKIDSASSSYQKEGKWHKDIDTTLLTLDKNGTFNYKWSPMFGPYSNRHIVTTGAWSFDKGELILNSKYQQGENRFFESYKPEYGDSIVKIYVQTYDSLIGFFQFQFIGVVKDTTRDSQMIFKDQDYPYNACSATFHFRNVDKIVFYGDFGRMPIIVPKENTSNHFLLQYNLSENWDYQYFKNFKVKIVGKNAILGEGNDSKIVLTKY